MGWLLGWLEIKKVTREVVGICVGGCWGGGNWASICECLREACGVHEVRSSSEGAVREQCASSVRSVREV